MKKTILFAIMAAVLGFTACSKEEPAQTETPQKGMVLRATVSQSDDTRASFTDNEGVWHFDYTERDQITVTNKIIDTYYTFTYNGTDFISTDAEPTSKPARWYAYYPSKDVSFVGQTGKWEDLANVYALVGGTPFFGGDVTGEDGLDITMDPKCAVMKIINQKGSIDINVKHKDNGYWIKGLKDSQASFVPTLGETKQTFLSTTEAGTYYVAVPAGTPLTVYDGDKVIRSTSKGLTAGMYYEITVIPAGALPGKFSVNADKQVYFSQGNLYHDGSSFKFAAKQYDFYGLQLKPDDGYDIWGLFGWSTYGGHYGMTPIDYHYSGSFKDWGSAVDSKNIWRTPSTDEWQYLFDRRIMANGKERYTLNITYGEIMGIVLYPDDFNGSALSPEIEYTDSTFPKDCVFLPAAGWRFDYDENIREVGQSGFYWSSSADGDESAFNLYFRSDKLYSDNTDYRKYGYSVRLVTDCE